MSLIPTVLAMALGVLIATEVGKLPDQGRALAALLIFVLLIVLTIAVR